MDIFIVGVTGEVTIVPKTQAIPVDVCYFPWPFSCVPKFGHMMAAAIFHTKIVLCHKQIQLVIDTITFFHKIVFNFIHSTDILN